MLEDFVVTRSIEGKYPLSNGNIRAYSVVVELNSSKRGPPSTFHVA